MRASPTAQEIHYDFDLISGLFPFGRSWYSEGNAISNATGYANFFSRSHDAVIRVNHAAGNVIETHERGQVQRAAKHGQNKKPPRG